MKSSTLKNKYKKKLPKNKKFIDVYDVLKLFDVTGPGSQHAVKKLLCSGQRGYKNKVTDLKESIQAIKREIEIAEEYE